MFSLLQNRHPLAFLFLLPITAGLSFAKYWFAPDLVTVNFSVFQKFLELPKIEVTYIYFGLLCLNAVVLSVFFNRMNLIDHFSHVSGLFYAILTFAFNQIGDIHLLVADFFLILGVMFLVQIKNGEDAKSIVFNAALLFGIGFVFNPLYLPIALLLFVGLARTKSFVFREYFIIIVALIVVAAYVAFYYYYYQLSFKMPFVFLQKFTWPELEFLIALGCANFLVFLAFITRSRTVGSPGIRIEKLVKFMFTGFFLQFLFFFFFQLFKVESTFQAAIFIALYAGYSYNFSSVKWLYNFLGYVVVSVTILQFLDLF